MGMLIIIMGMLVASHDPISPFFTSYLDKRICSS